MTVEKLTDSINKIVIAGLVLMFALFSTLAINAKPLSSKEAIVGVWQLNRPATGKSAKQVVLKNARFAEPFLFAPDSLVLAADEQISEITINEEFKEFIHTQTLPLDGTVITKKIQPTGQVSAKAYWKDKKLVVEITTSTGRKMTETFELSSNQKRLNVTLEVNDSQSAKPVVLRRVYNRMAERVEDNTADIGISEYPF